MSRLQRMRAAGVAVVVAGVLGVLAVGAVRSVRSELVLGQAWKAVDASRWQDVLALTEPLLADEATALRAAELQCWALLALGERDRCGAVLDRALAHSESPSDPLLTRLAVAHRQQHGELEAAFALAHHAAGARPDDAMLVGLELSTQAALEREERVLAEFERRLQELPADAPAASALRVALAERYGQRAEWADALRVLGDRPPALETDASEGHAARLRWRWFEERASAQAALGRLSELQATFERWAALGGDPVELAARYAVQISIAQLPDPQHSWTRLLQRSAERSEQLADPLLRRQLFERWIAHLLVAADDAAALAAFELAERRGVELQGITREQIERGAAMRRLGDDRATAPDAVLAFAIPAEVERGTLFVSNHAEHEPDARYEERAVEGGSVELVERRPASWPERWVLRDEQGELRASGSVWSLPGARTDLAIAARAAQPGPTNGRSHEPVRSPPESPGSSEPAARAPADGRARVFAIVLDCADWRLVQYLRTRSELPVLDGLFARGHRAVLHSDPPLTAAAMESLVWPARGRATSIAGLVHQLGVELSGLASVGDNPFAFLAPLLPEGESLFEVVGSESRVAANMLFAHGGIGSGRHAEMVGPDGERRRIEIARARRPLRPEALRRFDGLAARPEAKGHVESIAAQLDAAIALASQREIDLLALRLESLDILTHALFSELASTRQDDGRSNLLAAYRYVDARIGELDAVLDADDVLVVMSDHGIRSAMEHEEDALFVAVGQGIRPGRAAGRPDLRGVARTLAAFAGVETPWPATGVAAWLEQDSTQHASVR